ncbi:MAG TPA: UDP-N-acetylmuramate dehydrogenase [Puia sp.]|nr:UDP-N-acetylmuramate dehydrogenase [Puia sp.]
MTNIIENASLKAYNTFGINATARYFSSFASVEELGELLGFARERRPLILGGGSNILLRGDVDGLVLLNRMKGIDLIHEDEHHYYIKAGAGENWHEFVRCCLGRDWAGVENLSLIPGNVGAAPMQNIGAYGVEIKEVFHELEAWSLEDGKLYTFTLNDCQFGYRESIFKSRHKGRFVILSVTFRLNKVPEFHIGYGAIREELEKKGVHELSIQAISDAVIHIRQSKLPDPAEIGNAGSFFKNPVVPDSQFAALRAAFPGIVGYPASSNTKLAAGWLIEQCGWKGFRKGDAGCHVRQALVLVNYGNATGKEIYDLSEEILQSVKTKFGVTLEREVNLI